MLPDVVDPAEWRRPENLDAVAAHLLANMTFDVPLSDLRDDVVRALEASDLIEFEWGTSLATTCELHGTYSRRPPRIRVARGQSTARANFTAAHEFGHHLQQENAEWALDVFVELRRAQPVLAAVVGELVSNHVAVQLLMPQDVLASAWSGRLTPDFVRELTRDGRVSRQAAAIRAVNHAADERDVVVIVADPLDGRVLSSSASALSQLYPPPTNSFQSDLRTFGDGATGLRQASEGFQYSTGRTRADITYDWGWDHAGQYMFVVARPTYRFGTPQWDGDDVECVSENCEHVFSRSAAGVCPNCRLPICPACNACGGCEKKHGALCMNCFTLMSLSESQRGPVHDECPV